jgi:uncharacterized protein (TIGR04141 family)
MLEKMRYYYQMIIAFVPFLRFRKNLFGLSICLMVGFSFPVFAGKEAPEVVEKIRGSLKIKRDEAKSKATFAKTVGVTDPTLKKFIDKESIQNGKHNTIIETFKTLYKSEYEAFLTEPPSIAPASFTKELAASSQAEPLKPYTVLDLSALPFHTSYPDTYSLFMVDSSLVSFAPTASWEQHADFKNLGPRFLRPALAVDKDLSFAGTEEDARGKKQWILKDEKIIPSASEEQKPYYIVQLFKKREEERTVNLVKSLTERQIVAYDGFDLQAALIIFPQLDAKAMVYGLGRWETLLNPHCVVPQWGLRMVTSGQICNPSKIKGLHADHFRTSNPFSRREKVAALQPIEVFGLEIGSEELKTVALMPNKSFKTAHVLEGTDHLKFTVNPSETATLQETLLSLQTIATYFMTLTNDPRFHVHSRMREFIDDEVKDAPLLVTLDQRLQNLLKTPNESELLFLHDVLWREMKSKKLRFGGDKKRSIFEVLTQLPVSASVPQTIQVWKPRLKAPKEFDIRRIFHSLPIEHEGKFYRFDRGHWYQVDDSRFEGIKRILRTTKQPSASLHLPDYALEDTQGSTDGKKVAYKEAKYNLRVVQAINSTPGWKAVLLDRINVSLGDGHHIFEFADLLVTHGDILYIVHVKREEASDLSHHREQVERSADFLGTELTKKTAHTLFLQGTINGLYEKNGLSITKDKKQGKRITKGHLFLDYYASPSRPQDFLLALSTLELINTPFSNFPQHVFRLVDKEFFKDYPSELASALDALFDCVSYKKELLPDNEIEEFLNAVKQGIRARQLLFPQGPLKKSDLKKIKIVLAVIDDRGVNASSKGKEAKRQGSIFKNQDLWGLDRTRMVVEKTGLGFSLMVINENATDTEDAFGPIIKKERKENFLETLGDEPEELFSPFVIKTEPPGSSAQLPAQQPKKDLKSLFEATTLPSTTLDVSIVQKLQFLWTHDHTLHEYYAIPTVGDGDCFFHAAFTETGESFDVVQAKAAVMRTQLCDAVQQGHHVDDLRNLVYEHYKGLLSDNENPPEVPESIKHYMREKNEYASMYNNMQRFGISVADIPQPEVRFSEELGKAFVTSDHIKSYIERFRTVGGYQTYIPFRPDCICPANLLATIGRKRINIFTFHPTEGKLQFHKTAGTAGPVVNILHVRNHFVRLYLPVEEDASFHQCEQVWENYLQFTSK